MTIVKEFVKIKEILPIGGIYIMKRIISMFIALIMVLAICPLALAEGEEVITNIDIKNADVTPIWGALWNDNLDYELDDDVNFSENSHFWFNDTTDGGDFDYIEKGSVYSIGWWFDADSGYVFSEDTKVTINGSTDIIDPSYTNIDPENSSRFYVWAKPAASVEGDAEEIIYVGIDGVMLSPRVGETAGDSIKYDVASNKFDVIGANWFNDTENREMTADEKFEEGNSYSFYVDLQAKGIHYFDSSAVVLINGSENNVDYSSVDGDNDEYLTVWTPSVEPKEALPENVLLYEDFENFNEDNWTFIDADGDGINWELAVYDPATGTGARVYEGTYCIASASYVNNVGALTPDNWLISAPFTATADAEISWYDIGQDASWCAENYSVYVLPADYTDISEATEVYTGVSGDEYENHTASISAFAGQSVRIAFRHHDVTDMFRLNIDYIIVTGTADAEVVAVTGVELDKTEATIMDKGDNTVQLTAAVTPENATNKQIKWTSSDETVATVSNKGLVTGLKEGKATITATTVDGGFTATCEITVVKANFILYEDFETDTVENWTALDQDGDGNSWMVADRIVDGEPSTFVYEGEHCATSHSWLGDPLTPDNWLISPAFTPDETSKLSWFVRGQDPDYAAENYSVYVIPADAENTDAAIQIFTGVSTAEYVNETVGLEKYAGQEISIAFRHHDVTDMFRINIDLITVNGKAETVNEYTVTFVDGLTNETIDTVVVEEGKDVEFPAAPEHEGYEFKGWDKDGKNITEDTTITAQYEKIEAEILIGDVDGNGKVDTFDAVVVLKYAAEMIQLDDNQLKAADTNKDGTVNTFDAVLILKYAADMITEF